MILITSSYLCYNFNLMSVKLLPKDIPLAKRLFDLLLTVPIFLILSPFMLIISILVAWQHGLPVIFRQIWPGYHGKLFTIYKFRSMRDLRDAQGKSLPDKKRLTKFGRFLRKWSLDETPEFINVLRGEMSLVGPRPLLIE